MSRLGVGVLLGALAHDDTSYQAIEQAKGRLIERVEIDAHGDGTLYLWFTDRSHLRIWDDGRSCCEERYLHSDDDLNAVAGATLLGIEGGAGEMQESEYHEVHEMGFLVVQTTLGIVTIETHNVHNGYYGGFWMRAAYAPTI